MTTFYQVYVVDSENEVILEVSDSFDSLSEAIEDCQKESSETISFGCSLRIVEVKDVTPTEISGMTGMKERKGRRQLASK